jgi:hypothetical protein
VKICGRPPSPDCASRCEGLEVVNAGMNGSPPSYAEVLAAPVGGTKLSCVEALAFDLGRWLPMGGGACLTKVLRSLAGSF